MRYTPEAGVSSALPLPLASARARRPLYLLARATGPCLLGGRLLRVLLEQRVRHADAVDRGAHDPARVAGALAGGVEARQAGALARRLVSRDLYRGGGARLDAWLG